MNQQQTALRLALETFQEIAYRLEGSRIWGGMEWNYSPLHPFKYLPLRDKAREAIQACQQALAEILPCRKCGETERGTVCSPDCGRREALAEPQAQGNEGLKKFMSAAKDAGITHWTDELTGKLIGAHPQATPPASAQAGYKLVPVEPTPEMTQAAMTAWMTRRPFGEVYSSLLAAAPEATK